MKALTAEQVASFHYNGFLYPVAALSPEEVTTCLAGLERLETELSSAVAEASPHAETHRCAR